MRCAIKALISLILAVDLTTLVFAQHREHIAVAMMVGDLGNPFFVQMAAGAKAMAKEIDPGVEFTAVSGNYSVETQINQIDNFISTGVDLILLNPVDSKGIAPAVSRAKRAGIPVVAVGEWAEGGVAATVTFNDRQAGNEVGRYMAERLKGKGQVVIVNGPPTTAVTDRVEGFLGEIKKHPDIGILSQDQNAGGSRDGGLRVMSDLLTAFQKIDAVFAVNDPTAIGCDQAAKRAKRNDFFIVSVDGEPGIVPALKDPDSLIVATAANDPYLMAERAVKIGYAIMKGEKPEAETLVPALLVTSDNVSQYINPATPSVTPVASPKDPRARAVLYATNRVCNPYTFGSFPTFSEKRSFTLTFGSAVVWIPDNHSVGSVEGPNLIKYFVSFFTKRNEQDPKTEFILQDLRTLTKEQFLQLISKMQKEKETQSALVYVHGFATPFEEAIYRLAQIVFDTNYSGIPIAFSWPSQGKATLFAYNYDRESALAEYSKDAFLEVLHLLQTNAHVSKIYVVAHSMGNEIVMDAIAKACQGTEKPLLTEIILAAPDVDWDSFAYSGHLLTDVAKGVTLYASSTDTALGFSADLNGAANPRAGSIREGRPLVLPGIETIDMTALGPDIFALTFNHDVAFRARQALDDIGRLFNDGTRPPSVRTPTIRGVPEGSTPRYWAFPK